MGLRMVAHSTGTVIVGQRALFREGVAALLRHTRYKVIATAQRYSELRNVHASTGPRTLVILGVDDESASEVSENIKALRSRFPSCTMVVIAETRGPASFQQIMMTAPDGYVSNLKSRDVLLKLLDVALLGQQVIVLSRRSLGSTPVDEDDSGKCANTGNSSAGYDRQCLSVHSVGASDPHLSQRERQILIRLAQGDSNKQIARLCNITESTVKVHLKAILRKITVHNRTQAAIWAIANGYRGTTELEHGTKTLYGAGDRPVMQEEGTSSSGKPLGLEVAAE
jgi:two-component system, NarL family, nitrate/nitrite response regulator NarL